MSGLPKFQYLKFPTLDDEYTMKYTHDLLYNCTLEAYIILLANETPIKLIKKTNKH